MLLLCGCYSFYFFEREINSSSVTVYPMRNRKIWYRKKNSSSLWMIYIFFFSVVFTLYSVHTFEKFSTEFSFSKNIVQSIPTVSFTLFLWFCMIVISKPRFLWGKKCLYFSSLRKTGVLFRTNHRHNNWISFISLKVIFFNGIGFFYVFVCVCAHLSIRILWNRRCNRTPFQLQSVTKPIKFNEIYFIACMAIYRMKL